MSEIRDAVLSQIKKIDKAEVDDKDVDKDVASRPGVGFDFTRYPTLLRMAHSRAFIKAVSGPAGCLGKDTEVMTRNGWVRIEEAPEEILVYNPKDGTAFFEKPEFVKLPHDGKFHRFFTTYSLDMTVTEEHRIWYQTRKERLENKWNWHITTAGELAEQYKGGSTRTGTVPKAFKYLSDTRYPLSDTELKIQVMIAADGSFPKNSKSSLCSVVVRKERKKQRIRYLLNKAGIPFEEKVGKNRPTEVSFRFYAPERNKDLSKYLSCNRRQLRIIAIESLKWDGHKGIKGYYFSSNSKVNCDAVQFAFTAIGFSTTLSVNQDAHDNWNATYRVSISKGGKNKFANLRTASYEEVVTDEKYKYCYTTSTGMFVVRQNNSIFCTGNSAKTTGIIWMLMLLAISQAPINGLRSSRVLVGRNTMKMLRSSTIQSFKQTVGNLLTFKTGSSPMRAFLRCSLNDGTTVNCDFDFISFDSTDSLNTLLGYEPTVVFLDEVSELPEELVLAAARRIGRFPDPKLACGDNFQLLMATNGPKKNHWLYKWAMGEMDEKFAVSSAQMGRPYFEFFKQPAALIRPKEEGGQWLPNPMAENIENLMGGYAYYYQMLTGDDDAIRAYVEGDFSDLRQGKVVFPSFSKELHVIPKDRVPANGQPLYVSFDFGRTPVCLVAVATSGGRVIIIDEVMGEDMSVKTLWIENVEPVLRKHYPQSWVERGWGDPAGQSEAQSVDLSPYDVLQQQGVDIQNPGTNLLPPRLEAVREMLNTLATDGKPMLQITDNCRYTINALNDDYIYEQVRGKNDVVKDIPTKTHENWVSDLADAVQYLCLGFRSMYKIKERRQKFARKNRRRTRYI